MGHRAAGQPNPGEAVREVSMVAITSHLPVNPPRRSLADPEITRRETDQADKGRSPPPRPGRLNLLLVKALVPTVPHPAKAEIPM